LHSNIDCAIFSATITNESEFEMKTVLMVDNQTAFLSAAEEAIGLIADNLNFLTASDGEQAREIMSSQKVDLVMTDSQIAVMDGIKLATFIAKVYPGIPIIVLTDYGRLEIQKQLVRDGTLYLEKPIDFKSLLENINSLLAENVRSTIQGFSLPSFLQLLQLEEKSKALRVTSKEGFGYLYLEKGELIDAYTSHLTGESAAIEIIGWEETEIELYPISNIKRQIDSSLMNILLRVSKKKDEQPHSPGMMLNDAVNLAEERKLKKAGQILMSMIKDTPRNFKSWFWISRIAGSMRVIQVALRNAYKLAPKNPEVIEEIRKFNLALKHAGKSDVRRCPFCWSPVKKTAMQCHYCKAHLMIHRRLFETSTRNVKTDILEDAVERYTKVVKRGRNVICSYYLSLAHLNLEHWEDALNQLYKTVKLQTRKEYFSDQLKLLLKHMASAEVVSEKIVFSPAENPGGSEIYRPLEKRKKILVVEDSSTTRKVISVTLDQHGYETIEARDGLEALSRLNEETPDLILLDIVLPKMDGYKILSIVKCNQEFEKIPVIMLTSKNGFINKVKSRVAGSVAHLTKPFDPADLIKTVKKFI
jgi:twitching motility two-component system response regulator PilG